MFCTSRIVGLACSIAGVLVLSGCGGCKPPVESAQSANTTGPAGITAAYGDFPSTTTPQVTFVYTAGDARCNLQTTAIEEALATRDSFFFPDVPLVQVVEYIESKAGIDIVIDQEELNDIGSAEEDVIIALDLDDASLATALTLMLKPHKLAWTVDSDLLLITTPDEAANILTTKVYDVAGLVTCLDPESEEVWEDYDTLIDLIEASIEPDSWDDVGGTGSIRGASFGSGKLIVISQTYHVHKEIEALLKTLKSLAQDTDGVVKPPVRKQLEPKMVAVGPLSMHPDFF